jgi:hypothetical protein
MFRRSVLVLLSVVGCGGPGAGHPGGPDGSIPGADDAGGDAPIQEVVPDPCEAAAPVCPAAPASLVRGGGLRELDRCAFPLAPADDVAAGYGALIDALPAQLARVTLADVAGDLNRTATRITAAQVPGSAPGIRHAYAWQSGDESVTYWTPQGVTGSFDGIASGVVAGKKLVLVSWYYTKANEPGSTAEKGVRIAIADVTDPANVRYRFALLAEPVKDPADATRASFRSVPVHAGGLAWSGDRLYVPITGSGFRVFDLSRILKLDGLDDQIGYDPATGHYNAHGYTYMIPQIAKYTSTGTCAPRFSFVALDRSSSPPSLISGEYDAASIEGRLYRWPLAANGDLLRTDRGRVIADGAWFEGESHVQGAMARDGTFWLSSSRPAGGAGELDRTALDTPTTRLGWSDSPEDLAFDPQASSVWSVSEGIGARYLFEVALSAID